MDQQFISSVESAHLDAYNNITLCGKFRGSNCKFYDTGNTFIKQIQNPNPANESSFVVKIALNGTLYTVIA
jgi:hypothetical protein